MAFNKIKQIAGHETLLSYPDFNLPFEIYANASHTQLGAVISHNNKPIAIWKMFCRWFSAQIFAWTIMIIEYPMIGFLTMHYFFVHVLNAQIISKLLVAMH